MPNQNPTKALVYRLMELGNYAQRFSRVSGDPEERDLAIKEFTNFFESIPEQAKNNPKLSNEGVVAGVIFAGIKFARIGDMKTVPRVAGRVLALLESNDHKLTDPIREYFVNAIRQDGEWKRPGLQDANLVRVNTLRLVRQTILASPKLANSELTKGTMEAAFLPLYTDKAMVDLVDQYLESGRTSEEIATMCCMAPNETLFTILATNRRLVKGALEVVVDMENSVDRIESSKLRPIVSEAVKQTRRTILDAAKFARVYPQGLPKDFT
ncbi:MAG: hypothetical protein WC521_06740 [Bdellovibrionales bacterium]